MAQYACRDKILRRNKYLRFGPENALTDPLPDAIQPAPRPDAGAALGRALHRAGWVLFWERVWPRLAWVLTVLGLFLAVSWLGVWLWLPPIGRGLGIFVFAVSFAWTIFNTVRALQLPARDERLRRL